MFHLSIIRHSFGEQSIGYCLIKQLIAEKGSTVTTNMVHTGSSLIYKVCIKRKVIDDYNSFIAYVKLISVNISTIVKLIIVMHVTDRTIINSFS